MSVKEFLSKSFVEPGRRHDSFDSSPASKLQKQLDAIEARLGVVTKAICEQMYADTLAEALAVADKTRNEAHVMEIRDERAELAFLNIRKTTLTQRLAELK